MQGRGCMAGLHWYCFFFFFNDTATTEIYTLSLHDASSDLLGSGWAGSGCNCIRARPDWSISGLCGTRPQAWKLTSRRSEEHTSELQSQSNLVCRLLLEKKNSSTPTRPAPTGCVRHHHLTCT